MYKTKKLISLLLVTLILFGLCASVSSAEETDERGGIEINSEGTVVNAEVYRYAEGYYYTEKTLEKLPRTFEAWVYVPLSAYYGECGVVFGNYAGYTKDVFINFEIGERGAPRLLYNDSDGTQHEFSFENAAVSPDTWTHVAIAYGAGENENQVCCYINGEIRQTKESEVPLQIESSFMENKFCIAGDMRALNLQYFKGALSDLAIYSDVRTKEEILSDMVSPDVKDEEMLACYILSEASEKQNVSDASGNGYDMLYGDMWVSEKEMSALRKADKTEYSYSIAFIPDPQYTTGNYPEKLHYTFDWLIDNAQKKNIQYVVSLGDMTNTNTEAEWKHMKSQTDRLSGVVPYTVLRGNHDITYNNYALYFDQYYSQPDGYYYQHVQKNGGFYDTSSVRNTYLLFSAGKVDYLLLNLDFGASDKVLLWADSVLKEYSDRRVIAVTHAYLSSDGSTVAGGEFSAPSSYGSSFNDGDDIWEKLLSKHENVSMVVSGHIHSDNIVVSEAEGINGNTVQQVLIDAQTADSRLGGLGLVAMMYFTEGGECATVEYYSTVWKRYFKDSNSRLKLDFEPALEEVSATPEEPKDNNSYVIITIFSVTVGVLSVCLIGIFLYRKRKKRR